MNKQTFRLISPDVRAYCCDKILDAPVGYVVEIKEPTRSVEQNAHFHAMFSDIAKQCEFMGQKWPAEDWKRLLADAFVRAMRELGTPLKQDGRIVPALNGDGFVQLGIQTRRLSKEEARNFVEFLKAWGAEQGVKWSWREE
ncbi:MAG: recombination protein NinB [Dehalococcoidia bacterium]|nr:recombination protein NinB [Dehalococcoidia bacterium]